MISSLLNRVIAALAVGLGVATEQKLIPEKYAGFAFVLLAIIQSFSGPITNSSSDNLIARAAIKGNKNESQKN